MYDLIIIGGGPAALAAAAYALEKQLDVLIVYEQPGGRNGVQQSIAGQPGDQILAGSAVAHLLEQQVMQSGCTVHSRVVKVARSEAGFRVETAEHSTYDSRAVIVATGASPVPLDVPGATRLLEHGLGYSATTYAAFMAGKRVVVIGATDRSLRGVLELALVATQVYVITHTHGPAVLPAPLGDRVRAYPNVVVLEGYDVVEIVGNSKVESIVVWHATRTERLAVDRAFVDVGLMGNSEIVQHLVKTDVYGHIKITDRHATLTPGLFAAGDVTIGWSEQKLVAIGEGARAAVAAYEYVLHQRYSTHAEHVGSQARVELTATS